MVKNSDLSKKNGEKFGGSISPFVHSCSLVLGRHQHPKSECGVRTDAAPAPAPAAVLVHAPIPAADAASVQTELSRPPPTKLSHPCWSEPEVVLEPDN
jgi:hypothetical protein